jgi:predicted membrane-bound spermidine synthase
VLDFKLVSRVLTFDYIGALIASLLFPVLSSGWDLCEHRYVWAA